MATNELKVRTDSARNILQSADRFRTAHAAIWEYVANSLQYTDDGVRPSVIVSINDRKKTVSIADNGEGMDRNDLAHFFTMQAENRERKRGVKGRGLWGTGKSAAFAIGSELSVSTTKNGLANSVVLTRRAIDRATGADSVPVQHVLKDESTDSPNGTVILISGIHVGPIDRNRLIQHVEQHLAHYPEDYSVFIDRHECEAQKPEVEEEHKFVPADSERRSLGDIELVVQISKTPLDEGLRGIRITSNGNWHSTTLATSSGKPMSEYLFGQLEVPALENYAGPTSPFDNSRDGWLNPKNDVVAALLRFIGPAVEGERRKLHDRARKIAKGEEAKRLARQAEKVANILSQDFKGFQVKLRRAQSAAAGRDLGRSYSPLGSDDPDGPWVEGGDQLASKITPEQGESDPAEISGEHTAAPNIPDEVTQDAGGETTGAPTGGKGQRKSRRGGFVVEHAHLGEQGPRGRYVSDARTIFINLDHPEIAAARRSYEIEDPVFIRLTHEAAIAEYAAALAQELIANRQVEEPEEVLFEVRQTVTRVSAQLAGLYS